MPLERQRRLLQDLEPPLAKFAAASGLTLSLYDLSGLRQVGPIGLSPLSRSLADAGAWDETGVATETERGLSIRAISDGKAAHAHIAEVVAWAIPVRVRDVIMGAVVFGWVPDKYGSSLGAAMLAKSAGSDPVATWRHLRATVPVSSQRMGLFAELLENLLTSHASHLEYQEASKTISRTRDQFIAEAAHELRSPLAAIALRVESLLLDDLREDLRIQLGKILASVASESRLIEDLIEASQTLTGQLKVNPTPNDLSEIVGECVESFVPSATKKGLTLAYEPAEQPVTVAVDEVRLKQALSNLIGNALKFTNAGGRVAVKLDVAQTDVTVSVIDTGRGLTAEQRERVFEAFYKSDHDNETGLGLGLAITRQIVELHGGALEVTSEGTNRGATFSIRLPRAEP